MFKQVVIMQREISFSSLLGLKGFVMAQETFVFDMYIIFFKG